MPDLTMYQGNGEWSALYVDGRLDRAGDHYLIDERIRELAGVTVIEGDDFLRGQNKAAQTLAEVEAYTDRRDRARKTAADLRADAAKLLADAERIEVNHP